MTVFTEAQLSTLRDKALQVSTSGDAKAGEKFVAAVASKSGKIMVEAGYATWAAAKAGTSNKRMAEIFGKGTSTITLYRRLGAYLVAGGNPDSDTWRTLSSKSKANFAPVGALLDSTDEHGNIAFKAEEVDSLVSEHFTPDGQPLHPTPRTGRTSTGDVPAREQGLAAVRLLSELEFSVEDWAVVESAIMELRARKVAAFTEAAKVAKAAKAS